MRQPRLTPSTEAHWQSAIVVAAAALLILTSLVAAQPQSTTKPAHNFARWEKSIAAFEAQDRKSPPAKGQILFVGASTIVRWKSLAADFPNHRILNRGFGGNQIIDSAHFADRMIFPYEPKMIFLRAGGNDIHAGKTPQEVFADFQEFVRTIRARLPEIEIVFMSLAPSPARWDEREKNLELNGLIKQYIETHPHLKYIETYDMTLTPGGKPREDVFVEDKLHFNAEGYKLLAERVRPFMP